MPELIIRNSTEYIVMPDSVLCSPLITFEAKGTYMQLLAVKLGLERPNLPTLKDMMKTKAFEELISVGFVTISGDTLTITDEARTINFTINQIHN